MKTVEQIIFDVVAHSAIEDRLRDLDDPEPPVSTAHRFEGSCEACGVAIQVGDPAHVYEDAVVHASCPGSRERARV